MMKNELLKLSFLLLVTVLFAAVGFVGCDTEEEEPVVDEDTEEAEPVEDEAPEEAGLADGTYTGYSEADERGFIKAEVTVEQGSITTVELAEFQNTYFKKDQGYGYDEWHEAMEELPRRFVEADSHEIDVFTGATGTSQKAMDAVEKALQRAKGVEGPFDGTFFGASEVSERDGRNIAWVTVQNGEIVEVELAEWSDIYEGELKEEDYNYQEWHEAMEEMPGRFVEANSAEVDVYTGATGSSEGWMLAVKRALEKAGF